MAQQKKLQNFCRRVNLGVVAFHALHCPLHGHAVWQVNTAKDTNEIIE
jgi:hypothetical protein